MNGWVKHFGDGKTEEGYDHLVKARLASWKKGRLNDIVKVILCHDKLKMSLEGTGEFWQSDTYEARMLVNEGQMVERTLYKRIHEGDKFITFKNGYNKALPFQIAIVPNVVSYSQSFRGIFPHEIGKWVIMSMTPRGFHWKIGDR